MLKKEVVYCELCGAPITGRRYIITVEGIELIVCEKCYRNYVSKHSRKKTELLEISRTPASAPARASLKREPVSSKRSLHKPLIPSLSSSRLLRRRAPLRVSEKEAERYEVVADYAMRVKRARERLGLSQRDLAIRVRESERTIRRIEAGVLRPTVDLARRLEKVLGVKLLEPIAEAGEEGAGSREDEFLTLGDIAHIKE